MASRKDFFVFFQPAVRQLDGVLGTERFQELGAFAVVFVFSAEQFRCFYGI